MVSIEDTSDNRRKAMVELETATPNTTASIRSISPRKNRSQRIKTSRANVSFLNYERACKENVGISSRNSRLSNREFPFSEINPGKGQLGHRPIPALGLSLNTENIKYTERPRSGSAGDDTNLIALKSIPSKRRNINHRTTEECKCQQADVKPLVNSSRIAQSQCSNDSQHQNETSSRSTCSSHGRTKSWCIDGATLNMQGLKVCDKGLVSEQIENHELIPKQYRMMPAHMQYVNLGILGRGASSIVYKAIHVPTLQLVAIKQVSVNNRSKRHQIAAELRAMGKNTMPIWTHVLEDGIIKPKSKTTYRRAKKHLKKLAQRNLQSNIGTLAKKMQRSMSNESKKTKEKLEGNQSCSYIPALDKKSENATQEETAAKKDAIDEEENNMNACPYLVRLRDAFTGSSNGGLSIQRPSSSTTEVSIVTELMVGSLQDFMVRGIKFTEHMVSHVARQCLLGLQYLHSKGYLHRDIKPGNILVALDGRITISDFGITRKLEQGDENIGSNGNYLENKEIHTQMGTGNTKQKKFMKARAKSFVGTATYMSPERINGAQYSFPSDIWALGLTLLGLSIGRFPVPGEERNGYWNAVALAKGTLCPESPPEYFSIEFSHFICECMRLDPKLRPSAGQLLTHPFLNKRLANASFVMPNVSTKEAIRSFEKGTCTAKEMEEMLCTSHLGERIFSIERNEKNLCKNENDNTSKTSWTNLWESMCVQAKSLPTEAASSTSFKLPERMHRRTDMLNHEETRKIRSFKQRPTSLFGVGLRRMYSSSDGKDKGVNVGVRRNNQRFQRFQSAHNASNSDDSAEEAERGLLTLRIEREKKTMKTVSERMYSEKLVDAQIGMICEKIHQWYNIHKLKVQYFTDREVKNLANQLNVDKKTIRRRLNRVR